MPLPAPGRDRECLRDLIRAGHAHAIRRRALPSSQYGTMPIEKCDRAADERRCEAGSGPGSEAIAASGQGSVDVLTWGREVRFLAPIARGPLGTRIHFRQAF